MMKWWGWGDPARSFPMADKPKLWPWIEGKLGITKDNATPPVDRSGVKLPPVRVHQGFVDALSKVLAPSQLSSQEDDRLLHAYGKSYPDLFKVRRGEVTKAPDYVVWPENREQVEALVKLAHQHEVVVIPFGGGTNIVGSTNPVEAGPVRTVVSVDMTRMNRLVELDTFSRTAVIEGGAHGPKLEADLAARGWSLGHYPDSFEYSTLGGWIATRSAGMQSDAYGKIEDMVVSLRLVSPTGVLATRTVPASSAGPDLNRVVLGSEGTLGIITDATMRVHRAPAVKDYRGFLFPSFEAGVAAAHECIENGYPPSMVRLQDAGETELAMQMKAPKTGIEGAVQSVVKQYLKRAGYSRPCIMVVGFEGDPAPVKDKARGAVAILKKHRGFNLGSSVGKTWSKDKFNIPYLRDYIMDYGCMADVAETSATWAQVVPLYEAVIAAANQRFGEEVGKGYIGCHISHTYATGACLYFTWAMKNRPGEELEQYYRMKRFITDTIVASGGTVSHHHAIGTEHMPWMAKEVGETGLRAIRALKSALDPKGICNPGKVIPPAEKVAARRSAESSAPEATI